MRIFFRNLIRFSPEADAIPNVGNDNNDNGSNHTPEKTFTQAEVNSLIKREKEAAKSAVFHDLGVTDFSSAKEALDKYRESENAKKDDLQRMTETAETYKTQYEETQRNNVKLQAQIDAIAMGANAETVSELVEIVVAKTNDQTDAKTVIENLKNNSAYSGFFKTVPNNNGTGNPPAPKNNAANGDTNYGKRLAEQRMKAMGK